MRKRCLCLILLCIAATEPVRADELSDASLALCEKVKSCAMAQIQEEDLTPQTREMMQPMLDSVCAQVQGSVSQVPAGHALYTPALACMQSMQSLSCEMMQTAAQQKTPECETFENLAREAGEP